MLFSNSNILNKHNIYMKKWLHFNSQGAGSMVYENNYLYKNILFWWLYKVVTPKKKMKNTLKVTSFICFKNRHWLLPASWASLRLWAQPSRPSCLDPVPSFRLNQPFQKLFKDPSLQAHQGPSTCLFPPTTPFLFWLTHHFAYFPDHWISKSSPMKRSLTSQTTVNSTSKGI